MHLRIETDSREKLDFIMETVRVALVGAGASVRFDTEAVKRLVHITPEFMDETQRKATDPKWGTPGLTCDPIVAKIDLIQE